MTSRKRPANEGVDLGGELHRAALDSHLCNKRCRFDLQKQMHGTISCSNRGTRPAGTPYPAPLVEAPNNATKQARIINAAQMQPGALLKDHKKLTSVQHAAVLQTFRPFLQQLAAGIVAGYTAVKARQNTFKTDTADSGSSGASIQGSLTAAAVPDGQPATKTPQCIAPQPANHNSSKVMGKASSLDVSAAPCLSQPVGIPAGADAVAVVVRKPAKKLSVLPAPAIAVRHPATAPPQPFVQTSAVAGRQGQTAAAVISSDRSNGMMLAALSKSASAESSKDKDPKQQQQQQLQVAEQRRGAKPMLQDGHKVKHRFPVALDLRGSPQPEYAGSCVAAKVPVVAATSAAPAPAHKASSMQSASRTQMPPPSAVTARPTAAVPSSGTRMMPAPLQKRSVSAAVAAPAARPEKTYYETVPNAADARKINGIRQHVMFLESTLGNMSPQVGSAYLFLADVLQCEGSQWSLHHAARARARAVEILDSTSFQHKQTGCGTAVSVAAVTGNRAD